MFSVNFGTFQSYLESAELDEKLLEIAIGKGFKEYARFKKKTYEDDETCTSALFDAVEKKTGKYRRSIRTSDEPVTPSVNRLTRMCSKTRSADPNFAKAMYLFLHSTEEGAAYARQIDIKLFKMPFTHKFNLRKDGQPIDSKRRIGPLTLTWEPDPAVNSIAIDFNESSQIIVEGSLSIFRALSWNFQLTKMVGRDADRDSIVEWALDDKLDLGGQNSVQGRLLSGKGGSGKTRLAIEAAKSMRDKGWTVGVLPTNFASGDTIAVKGDGLFLIIDYPEERQEIVDDLLTTLETRQPCQTPIRILLVSRRGPKSWQDRTRRIKTFTTQDLHHQSGLSLDASLNLMDHAVLELERLTGSKPRCLDGCKEWLESDPAHKLPLFTIAAAIHAVLSGDGSFRLGSSELLFELARRELDRVERVSIDRGFGKEGLARLLAMSVVSSAPLQIEDINSLAEKGLLTQTPDDDLACALSNTPWWQPPDSHAQIDFGQLAKLEPDRPAAAFLAIVLLEDLSLPLWNWLSVTAEASKGNFAAVLNRVAYDLAELSHEFPTRLEAASIRMLEATDIGVDTLERSGVDQVGIFSNGFEISVARQMLEDCVDELEAARILMGLGQLYRKRHNFDKTLEFTNEAHRIFTDGAITVGSQLGKNLTKCEMNLAQAYADLGNIGAAHKYADSALSGFKAHFDATLLKDEVDVGLGFSGIGYIHYKTGQITKAIELAAVGVDTLRRTYAADPHLCASDFAKSLTNLGSWQHQLGQNSQAKERLKEALSIFDELTNNAPDLYLADQATVLSTLSTVLVKLGQWHDALEMADRAILALRPMSDALPQILWPSMLSALNSLGLANLALGLNEEALETTGNAFELATAFQEQNPQLVAELYAALANTHAASFAAHENFEKAVEILEAAEVNCRNLAQKMSERYEIPLAMTLSNQASILTKMGNLEAAITCIKEAVDLRSKHPSQLFSNLPNEALARSLMTYSHILAEFGESRESLIAARKAAEIFEVLTENIPEAFEADYAESLSHLGPSLWVIGEHDSALVELKKACEISKRLWQERGNFRFQLNYAANLNTMAAFFVELGKPSDALASVNLAIGVFEQEERSTHQSSLLAQLMGNKGGALLQLGELKEGCDCLQGSVNHYERLASRFPEIYSSRLALAIYNFSNGLRACGRRGEARDAVIKSLQIIGPFFLEFPKVHLRLVRLLFDELPDYFSEEELLQHSDFLDEMQDLLDDFDSDGF